MSYNISIENLFYTYIDYLIVNVNKNAIFTGGNL